MSMIKLHCIKCPTINKSIFKETNEQDLKPLIQINQKGEKNQYNKFRNKKGSITTDTMKFRKS